MFRAGTNNKVNSAPLCIESPEPLSTTTEKSGSLSTLLSPLYVNVSVDSDFSDFFFMYFMAVLQRTLHHHPPAPRGLAGWGETRQSQSLPCLPSPRECDSATKKHGIGLTERNMGLSIHLWFDSAGFCVGTRHGPALFSCTSMGKALRR